MLTHVYEFDWVIAFFGLLCLKLNKMGIVLVCICAIRVVPNSKLQGMSFWDMNLVWFLVFHVRNSENVWYSRSSEQGLPRRENHKCQNICT